ncbi:dihydropteroate synthase [Candidatus Hydrogenedentota bacterium]
MYVIGERINGMFKDMRNAIKERDKSVVQGLANQQVEAGATALDINVGPASDKPLDAMLWLVEAAREVTNVPLCIDNPKWEIMSEVIPKVPGKAVINSCKADEEELDKYMALAGENGAGIIALTIDQDGVPSNAEKRVELGAQIVMKAVEKGVDMDDLFVDPVILPVNVAPAQPGNCVEALKQISMLCDPMPHLVLGLSNVSQGCKNRSLINRSYLVMAMCAGLDAAILNPMDTDLMNAAITTELLQAKAIYCDSFLEAYRMKSRSMAGA